MGGQVPAYRGEHHLGVRLVVGPGRQVDNPGTHPLHHRPEQRHHEPGERRHNQNGQQRQPPRRPALLLAIASLPPHLPGQRGDNLPHLRRPAA
ncbi:hypothetical protein [Couchioplanes caeruleus]|uniref:hypothetical protein n=1 Tax=Couchioplanes caeruleus TaxID=56438 RepID=UPI001160D17E|nr:hypothetical protein [Couchioplanes caeruleus]